MSKKKHRRDRKDAYYISDLDPMHKVMPYMLPGRTANEAVVNEILDLTAVNAYLKKKNAQDVEFRYTLFHVITAAIAKTVYMRPHMNRFVHARRFYQRKDITFGFVAKKQFAESSADVLIILKIDQNSETPVIDQVHGKIQKRVTGVRKEGGKDEAGDIMTPLSKLPRPLLSLLVKAMRGLSYIDKLPESIKKVDPYHTTAFIANLGSIKLSATYHHLAEWGTNSMFLVIGEKKKRPYYDDDGNVTMKDSVELGLTLDERIGNGYYFAKSLKLIRDLIANPEALDLVLEAEISEIIELEK